MMTTKTYLEFTDIRSSVSYQESDLIYENGFMFELDKNGNSIVAEDRIKGTIPDKKGD